MLRFFKTTVIFYVLLQGLTPASAQNTILTTSAAIPGGGVGTGNVLIGPGNAYSSSFSGNSNTYVGAGVGLENAAGHNNSFFGRSAGGRNTWGNDNSFMGYAAGYSNTVGYENVFMGSRAGYHNTSGKRNSFMGAETGYYNTTGDGNSFMGFWAGYRNTTGENNSFVGLSAGYNNTTGINNSFLGYMAGVQNTTADNNLFVGYQAGYNNTTGDNNSFVGYQAGLSNTAAGSYNTFSGYRVGYSNTTGTHNSFMGVGAGYNNTTGIVNTSMGYWAGYSNITGNSNSFFGRATDATGANQTNLQRATALGYNAKVAVNDGLVLGDTVNVKVGIGTAYPNQRLTIRGNINYLAHDNSMMLKNRPLLHFNEHESLALGLGSEIAPGAEKTLVLGSKETTVQMPGIVNGYLPQAGQFLTVDHRGNVRLSQPRVQVTSVADWSDKVFEDGYALRPLSEVEEFVKTNRHLPGVPSAAEMVAEGMESAAFNARLLEKIEELTLYVVELEKKNQEFEKKVAGIDELCSMVLALKKRLDNQ